MASPKTSSSFASRGFSLALVAGGLLLFLGWVFLPDLQPEIVTSEHRVATSVQDNKANERVDASASTVSYLQKEDPGVHRVEADASVGTQHSSATDATPPLSGNVVSEQATASHESSNRYEPPPPMPAIYQWNGVAKHVPIPKQNDWMSETQFLERVLRAFGKQRIGKFGYRGHQRMDGFQTGKIFDENGMFAFDSSVKSVAFDVGAANNPLSFDLPIDASQVAFFIEPLQWKGLEESIERDMYHIKKRGGCIRLNEGCNTTKRQGCVTHWDGFCVMNRFFVFPAAVSHSLGHAKFHATGNPYCGSLEAFTEDTNKSAIDKTLKLHKNPEISGIFAACYKDAGKPSDVPTVSLKAIIERIPKHIPIKYVKIDAQGHDFKVLLGAGDQISRIEYARFEMQVDPPPGMRLVKDIPSYREVVKQMADLGFHHPPGHACHFDHGAGPFSKAVKEMECVFCRHPPCLEGGRPPMGPNPAAIAARNKKIWNQTPKSDRRP